MDKKPFFEIPDEARLIRAIGDQSHLSHQDNDAIEVLKQQTQIIRKPKNGDWLSEHKELGQGFKKFKEEFVKVDLSKKFMYIVPLEKQITQEFLEKLRLICEAFYYGFKVKVMDYQNLSKWKVENRINEDTQQQQYNAREILDKLLDIKPKDAYCVIAVMMTDLYPRPEWNFVFGLADLRLQIGVFSFARYNDMFDNPELQPDQDKILYRSCKVMCHEFGHQYNMRHCIFYQCIMNGSNHLKESDQKPFDFCPVCLKKLQLVLNFNILERYIALEKVCNQIGGQYFKKESQNIAKLISDIQQYSLNTINKQPFQDVQQLKQDKNVNKQNQIKKNKEENKKN